MIYVWIALFCALIFGLCFAVDRLVQRRRAKRHAQDAGVVRQPRKALILGMLLAFFGLCCALMGSGLLRWGGVIILLLGAVLLLGYNAYAVEYDEQGFTCRRWRTRVQYRYNQIRSEQVLQSRSGLLIQLYVGNDLVELSEAMTGVRDFLAYAYRRYLHEKGLEEAQCPPPDPDSLRWFPAPEAAAADKS